MSMDSSKGLRADILIIGAGQAGLAAANALRMAGLSFLMVDAGQAIGDSWRNRYDTLTLFTPRRISSLPGIPLIGDPDGYATKDEFSDYLERYAASNGYPIIRSTNVVRLEKVDGLFLAYLEGGGRLISQAVIVATGAFSTPRTPEISYSMPSDIQQMHVTNFRNAGSITSGPVLVVGDGASGRDVAMELAASHRTLLARGRQRNLLPENVLGRSIWWWLERLGLLRVSAYGTIGRRMRKADPFPTRGNDDASLIRSGVSLKSRLVALDGRRAKFEDGTSEDIGSIVWATGYAQDFRWIDIEGAVGSRHEAVHREGISPVAGLYYVGRPWQRNRASGLIAGVADDAAFVVEHLRRFRAPRT